MKAQLAGLSLGVLIFAGCASGGRDRFVRNDTLNEPSDRFAQLENRMPPNPNRPIDTPDMKTVPTVIQHDPALDKVPADRSDKGLAVNAGPDQLVRPQDPRQTDQAPIASGGPATRQQETVTSADAALAAKVKEALLSANSRKTESNIDPELTAKDSNGENKGGPNIDVAAKNGRVTISGTVKSDAERTDLEQAASHVPGVASVNNYLTVTKLDKQ